MSRHFEILIDFVASVGEYVPCQSDGRLAFYAWTVGPRLAI